MRQPSTGVLVVTATAEITGRGLAVFFEHDPDPIPDTPLLRVLVTRPDGSSVEAEAQREFARKVPPGEVVAFFLPGVSKGTVPVGSQVRLLGAAGA